jgi:hypothetical protein
MPDTAVTLTALNATSKAPGLVELTDMDAMALAQLLKRLSWAELRACAVNDAEAYEIRDGVAKLQRLFAEVGYAPR